MRMRLFLERSSAIKRNPKTHRASLVEVRCEEDTNFLNSKHASKWAKTIRLTEEGVVSTVHGFAKCLNATFEKSGGYVVL